MKTYSLNKLTNKHIGKKGTKPREQFDKQLHNDLHKIKIASQKSPKQ